MELENREITRNGRRDTYGIPDSKNKLVVERSGYSINDPKGKRISKYYDKILEFQNGIAVFENGLKKGVITDRGREIFKCLFDNVSIDGDIIRICIGNKWGFTDKKGKTICVPTFAFLEKFVDGYARFKNFDDKWGIVSMYGQIVIEGKYDFLGELGGKVIVAKTYKGYGGIDIRQREVIPFRYRKIAFEGDLTLLYNDGQDRILV